MDAAATIRDYYETLRGGEPLYPYFLDRETTVKFGLSERLSGYEEIESGLRSQTTRTDGWTVDSNQLVVDETDGCAWFTDDVFLAWSDLDARVRYEFDTRWSGTLNRVDDDWKFGTMHVSNEVNW